MTSTPLRNLIAAFTVVAATLFTAAGSSAADNDRPQGGARALPDAELAIQQHFPGEWISRHAEGELDGQKTSYLAAVVSSEYSDARLVLLRRANVNDSFQVIAGPQIETTPGRATFDVRIVDRSLFVSKYLSGGCCSHSTDIFQFKLRGDRFLLIGAEQTYRSMDPSTPSDEPGVYGHYRLRMSVNLLTGQVLHARSSWRAGEDDGNKAIDRLRRAEIKMKLAEPVALDLQTFSVGQFYNLVLATPSLCGSLDKGMKFRPYEGMCTRPPITHLGGSRESARRHGR